MVPSLPLRLVVPPRCALGCPHTPAWRFAAVGCDKAHFPDRAVWCDEPRHGVRRSVGLCDREQRIGGRTRAADEWLQMAGRALIRVVPRSQTGVVACCTEDDLDAIKARQPVLKESFLVGREARERRRRAVVGRCWAHAVIGSLRESRGGAERAQTDEQCCDYGIDRRVVQAHWLPPRWQHEFACAFYARFRQVSMCRPLKTALDIAEQLQ